MATGYATAAEQVDADDLAYGEQPVRQLQDRPAAGDHDQKAIRQIRTEMTGVRLSFTWCGTRKTLSADQRHQAATSFQAEREAITASKKLLDTSHEAFRRVTAVRSRATALWRSWTLPFPEPGIRLIRQDRVEAFQTSMAEHRDELLEAAGRLAGVYDELKSQARARLGELFAEEDYPRSLAGAFDMSWDYPSLEPPAYLLALSPEIYRQEQRRVAEQFDQAVGLAEQAFASELGRLVSHLAERLAGSPGEPPRIFKNSAIGNLREFITRFEEPNIRSSSDLENLVRQARATIDGVVPDDLRTSATLRASVSQDVERIAAAVTTFMAERPRRSILRRSRVEDSV